MKNNQTIAYLVLGAAAVYAISPKKSKDNLFFVPGVGEVPESELEALGYAKYNGEYYLKSDILAAAQSNGITTPGNIDVNTQVGFDILMTLLNAGLGITTTVINNTAQRKQDLIEQIETKYTSVVSLSYDPNFPFTNAALKALTIAKLQKVLSGDFAISGINCNRDLFYKERCMDGKYTSSNGSGSCSHHGGYAVSGGNWKDRL